MKHPRIIVALLCLVTAGCVSLPREADQRLVQAASRYEMIKLGMSRQDIIKALGDPQKEERDHARWEERYDAGNYAALDVDFDPSGNVLSFHKTKNRYSSFLGYHKATTQTTFASTSEVTEK